MVVPSAHRDLFVYTRTHASICDSSCHRQTGTAQEAAARFRVVHRVNSTSQSEITVTRIDANSGWTFNLTVDRPLHTPDRMVDR